MCFVLLQARTARRSWERTLPLLTAGPLSLSARLAWGRGILRSWRSGTIEVGRLGDALLFHVSGLPPTEFTLRVPIVSLERQADRAQGVLHLVQGVSPVRVDIGAAGWTAVEALVNEGERTLESRPVSPYR